MAKIETCVPTEPVVGLPLRSLMRKALRPIEVVDLPDLAPVAAGRPRHPARAAGLPPLIDLSGRPKVLLLGGPGGSGKTTAANFLVSQLDAAGVLLGQTLMAATDPGVVALPQFLPVGAVHKPTSRSSRDAEALTRMVLSEAESDDPPAMTIIDAGGGSNALTEMLEKDRKVFQRLEARGIAVVMLWFWTPRTHDLALLKGFLELGVKPTATAMVLNGAQARDGWEVYEPLRHQPTYQSAMNAGAAEVWMPALSQEVALEVERRGILFHYARHGKVPDWKRGVTPVEGDAATEVGLWWQEAEAEWASIGSWVKP